jgi:chromate transport protein ChrA
MRRYWRIAKMGLWLGATVFGGVAAAYPLVRGHAVELGEISGEEVDGLYALSVFLPGPSFLNLWGAVSARAGGMAGAFIGQVCLLLPAFLLVLILPQSLRIGYIASHTDGALNGAIWATAGLLIAAGIEQFRKLQGRAYQGLALLVLGALLLGAHPVLLLVAVLGGGAVLGYVQTQRRAA